MALQISSMPGSRVSGKSLQCVVLLVAIIIASLPAIFLAKYGIFVFDEPYSITTGIDYHEVPLAPLHGWLSSVYGGITGWQWLSFRYVVVFLNTLSIAIGAFYMLFHVRDFKTVLVVSFLCVLFGTLFRDLRSIYNWDCWGLPVIMLTIVLMLEYMKHRHSWMVVLMGVLSSVAGLMRLPNFSIVPIVILILLFLSGNKRISKRKRLIDVAIYIGSVVLCTVILLVALYGSIADYWAALINDSTGQHDIMRVLSFHVNYPILLLPVIAMLWSGYHILTLSVNSRGGKWLSIIAALLLSYALWLYLWNSCTSTSTQTMDVFVALAVLGLSGVIYRGRSHFYSGLSAMAIAIFLMGCVPFVGSNGGGVKFAGVAVIPIAIALFGGRLTRGLKLFIASVSLSLALYGYVAVKIGSFVDVGTHEATFCFEEGVMAGMKTSAEKGKSIVAIEKDFQPYMEAGAYEPLVIWDETDYIWDYIFLKRNNYMGNNLRKSGCYDDEEYVKWTETQIDNSQKPIAVLFVKMLRLEPGKKYGENSLMREMLMRRLQPVVTEDDYEIYVSSTDIPKNL